MKRKSYIERASMISTINFMMAKTGINREQATIAFNTILHYIENHPGEPLNKLVESLFGRRDDDGIGTLN